MEDTLRRIANYIISFILRSGGVAKLNDVRGLFRDMGGLFDTALNNLIDAGAVHYANVFGTVFLYIDEDKAAEKIAEYIKEKHPRRIKTISFHIHYSMNLTPSLKEKIIKKLA